MENTTTPRFVWVRHLGSATHGGTKATDDSYEIAHRSGWSVLDTALTGSLFQKIRRLVSGLYACLTLPRDAIVFVQLPIYGVGNRLLGQILLRKYRTVALLHDVERLRGSNVGSPEEGTRRCSVVIGTGTLVEHIRPSVASHPVVHLPVWDYLLAPDVPRSSWDPAGRIIFAGNLAKAKVAWLYGPPNGRPHLTLYGTNFSRAENPSDVYSGEFSASKPVFAGPIGWGLVWSGGAHTETSADANYERYNQAHKLSLYLACGLPVIVWAHAHVATFVREHDCGVVVDALSDVERVLGALPQTRKTEMHANACRIGDRLRAGDYLGEALAAAFREAEAIPA